MSSTPASTPVQPIARAERSRQTYVWLAVLGAAALLVARKPWALHTPQLWAEDGSIFLNEADSLGAAALFRAYQGYFHLLPRLIAWVARVAFDPAAWPAVYNGGALLVALAVLLRLASPRLAIPCKPGLILAIALVPQTGEVLFNVTNVQWLAAFFVIAQLLMTPAVSVGQLASDVAILLLAGLTGPFAVVLLPLFIWRAWVDRHRGNTVTLAAVAISAAIQGWALAHGTGGAPTPRPDHLDVVNYAAVVSNRVFVWPLLGPRIAAMLPSPAVAAIGIAAVAAVAYRIATHLPRHEFEGYVVAAALLLIAAISWRTRPDGWDVHNLENGDRYFFIPRVLFVWWAIWQVRARSPIVRGVIVILCVVGVVSQLPTFRIPAPPNYAWKEHCAPIRQGIPAKIPTLPEGWTLEYAGRPTRKP